MDCPDGVKAEYCVQVEGIGMIGATQISETVYEGTLTGEAMDEPISVVVILNQEDNSALVCIFETDGIRTNIIYVLILQNMLFWRNNSYIFIYRC
jgi:hypothetical protein